MIVYYGTREEVFTSREQVVEYMNSLLEGIQYIAIDVETVSLDNLLPIGLSIAPNQDDGFYFTLHPEMDQDVPWGVLSNPDIKKIFHNALFDLSALDEYKIDSSNILDTTILAHLLNIPSALTGFEGLVGMEVHNIKEYLNGRKTTLDIPISVIAKKCCQDSRATYALYWKLVDMLRAEYGSTEYFDTEMMVIPILVKMSLKGLLIDHTARKLLESKYEEDVEYYRGVCTEEGFNPASPQQVGFILAKRGNMLPMRRKRYADGWKTTIITDVTALEKLDDPMANIVLNFRKSSTALSTYIRPYEDKVRAYTRWHMDAVTGRISSTRRNLQNIPPDLRIMFTPDSEVFTDWDASQLELRVLAHLSQDQEMLHVFETGGDIHQVTADYMGIERKIAKNVNFAMIYGATDATMMETAHAQTISKARELKERWFDGFREAGGWILMVQERGYEDGHIETLYGRKIALPILLESEAEIARKAVNYPIQGSAAEIIKRAMIKCSHLPLVLQVHDELVADGDISEEVASLGLENLSPLYTPYKIKTTRRWE